MNPEQPIAPAAPVAPVAPVASVVPVAPIAAVSDVEHVAVVSQEGRYNFRAAAIIAFIAAVVDILIGVRFVLRLLAASDTSAFVSAIYSVTAPLVAPFHGIFGDAASGGSYFETAALVAMVVYGLLAWGLVALVRIVTAPKGTRPAAS